MVHTGLSVWQGEGWQKSSPFGKDAKQGRKQVREKEEVVKSRRGSRSKVSQACESHHLLLQFVVGSQRSNIVRDWINSQQRAGT